MSLLAVLFAMTMSMFSQPNLECRHGIHMHVIWQSPMCHLPGHGI